MPKAKQKVQSATERQDRGKSWTAVEEDLLIKCCKVNDKMDGMMRGVLGHEMIAQHLKEHGFDRSITSIQNKIKALKKKYHATLVL